jgi:hypothetical protein
MTAVKSKQLEDDSWKRKRRAGRDSTPEAE